MKRAAARLFSQSLLIVCVIAIFTNAASGQIAYDGVILDRPNKYDGMPAHLLVNGVHNMWWCSQSSSGDEIWYASKSGSLGPGGWSNPVKVFGASQSPWTLKHTCDPSIIKGSFSFNGTNYTYAMYYTSARSLGGAFCLGCDNAIGVAFSRTGLNWNANPTPIITPATSNPDFYGAGTSGVAYKPGTTTIEHVYLDSSQMPLIRLVESTDAKNFVPLNGLGTQLDDGGRNRDGQSPDIAYNPNNHRWYAAIQSTDVNNVLGGETRALRAVDQDSLLGPWEVIGIINSSVTGRTQNHNPGLAKNSNSTLYIDPDGWAYVFFTLGDERPATNTWSVAQARFRP